ncbi:MAG: sarcosine oxidase subunit alpha family protein [Alphaproteobacteria bacterium]
MTSQPYRLADGGGIDRSQTIRFAFNGRDYPGHPGDTLASALLANGVHMVARSFKYHRPRGIVAAGAEDPAALVQIGTDDIRTDPNTRVTEQEIYDGLVAKAQNCWPSLAFDIGALNDLAAPFMPAGFYYKTFMGSRRLPWPNWMTFEPFIRRAAGLGKTPRGPDPDRYESVNAHCDVLVVGGGPAGLAAALAAARSGARVILAEETPELGGSLLSDAPDTVQIDGKPARDWVWEARAELQELADADLLTRTTCFGYYGQNFLCLWQRLTDHMPLGNRADHLPRHRVWRVRARQVVLATGALERPLVFHENDRPGIMLAGAVRTYIHRYGVLPGRNPAVFTNNDSGWRAAFDMAGQGAEIAAIIDTRKTIGGGLLEEAARLGMTICAGSTVTATSGTDRIRSLEVRAIGEDGTVGRGTRRISCDLLAVSGGWAPNIALFSQSRGKLRYDEALAAYRPGQSWQDERSAGAANGTLDLAASLTEGHGTGRDAAKAAGFGDISTTKSPVATGGEAGQGTVHVVPQLPSNRPDHKIRAFIDLQDDVTTKDLRLAIKEGYASVEHAKRYTTSGMGTDQGKIANLNAFAFIASERGEQIQAIGSTTFRQPYKPVPFGAIAGQHVGDLFAPRRTTPMHAWHTAQNPVFETVGEWLRPRAFPRPGESFHETVQREAKAARTDIGVLDASTLGKIDVRGPDAREFLNRVYTNAWMKLAPGRCRYGLMLGEDGMVSDDGVTACLADDHFHMTTTTGGAASVMGTLEDYLQTEWPDLKVYLTSTTEQWAVASLCGPKSPDLVGELIDDFDPDPEKFAFMDWRDATMSGVPVRVFRVSFTGETAYEINCPATYGAWMWREIMEKGARYGITPYGTEAMHLLRAEKGFIIVGQDTDGTVTPDDLQMNWIVKKSGDFIGKRSLSRSDTVRNDRRQLVGLLTDDPAHVLMEGSQIIAAKTADTNQRPTPMLGHVTSSYFSPNLDRSIALALINGGADRLGETVYASRNKAAAVPVTITKTDFLAEAEAATDGGGGNG